MNSRRIWFLVLGLLILAFFAHLLLPAYGEVLPGEDFEHQFYPWYKFISRSIDETGDLPLWNPHQFLGTSLVSNPQVGLAYPPNWLMFMASNADVERLLALLIVLHALWAGVGMVILMRLWGAVPPAALVAGLLVATGGFLAARVRAGHYSMIVVFAWLPWILAGYRLAVQRRHPIWALPGGVALGMGILAGYPQLIYFVGLALAVEWVYEALIDPDREAIRLRTRQLVLIGLVALLLSAVSWLPTLDYLPKASRLEDSSMAFSNQHALPANRLLTLLIPNLFGARIDGEEPYWGDVPHYEEAFAYTGLLPLVALLLIFRLRQRGLWFFGALVLLGIILSLGFDGVLWLASYRWVPFLRSFRAPARALGLTNLGLAGLLALTLTTLGQMPADQRRDLLRPLVSRILPVGLVLLWGGALLLTAAGTGMTPGDQANRITYMGEQLGLAGLFWALGTLALWAWTVEDSHPLLRWALALTLIIAVLDLWHISWPLTNTAEPTYTRAWEDAAVDIPIGAAGEYGRVFQMYPPPGIPNGATWTGHQSAQGYDPTAPEGWAFLNKNAGWDPGSPPNRLFGIRYLMSTIELQNYDFEMTGSYELIGIRERYFFYENTDAMPRVYLAARYEVEPNRDTARARLENGEAGTGELVLLADDPGCEISGSGGTATITDYQPNEVTVRVEVDGPGLLVLSDEYDDDWRVQIDGEDADLLQANIALRGLCVPAGSHTVRFVYRPWAFYAGVIVSAVSGLALAIFGAVMGWRMYRRAA